MPRTGSGRVYQRGNVWWIQYGHRGRTYRESSGSAKKGVATALLKKRLGEIGNGMFVGSDAEKVTLEDLSKILLDDYRVNGQRSIERAEGCLARVREYFDRETRAVDITTDRLNSYVVRRQSDGAATATIKRELAILCRAFTLAIKAGRLSRAPSFPTLRVNNARKGFVGGGDLERVIRELPDAIRPVVWFAALTGWRRGEILSRTWAHVDFERGVIRLEPGETKNREGREFPFRALPPLAELLERQREHTRAVERETGRIVPWVFHRDGERIKSLRNAWAGACRRAGVPAALFHDLRRTAVRNLERAGVPRSVAMKLTGHKTESVYRRYAIADAAALAEGVEKLARLHAGRPAPATVLPIARGAEG